MGGFVWAVRSGLVWPPFDPGAAARYYDFMPYILHLPWKEEVLVDAPKRSVYQLSLWLSCHIPPRCRWSVPGPQYARTSPNRNSANFAFWGFSEVRRHGVLRACADRLATFHICRFYELLNRSSSPIDTYATCLSAEPLRSSLPESNA